MILFSEARTIAASSTSPDQRASQAMPPHLAAGPQAWTLLTPDSLNRLLPAEPHSLPKAIGIAAGEDAGPPELASAPLLATTRMLIEQAGGDGLKLTATRRPDIHAFSDEDEWRVAPDA